MNNLINVTMDENNEVVISGRELHEFLEVKDKYTQWFSRMAEYGFAEDVDFALLVKDNYDDTAFGGIRRTTDHALKLDMAANICRLMRRNEKAAVLYKQLIEIQGKEVIVTLPKRKELEFEVTLKKLLKGITPIVTQKQVQNYRIDFYLPNYNLAIEYDEAHHRYREIEDEVREKMISKELRCKFIRVKENLEFEAINKILKELFQNG